jgi:alkylhydroperoxidase family enzyme
MARVAILPNEKTSPELKELFQKMETRGGKVLNLFKVMANSPEVGRAFLKLGNTILMKSSLNPRLRELAILRVGALAQATYEWTQHVPIARRVGVSQRQIDALGDWKQSPDRFNDQERAVLAYTDAVAEAIRVPDETFAAVRAFLNDQQLVELTTTIGYYGMVSRILEALEIELEK